MAIVKILKARITEGVNTIEIPEGCVPQAVLETNDHSVIILLQEAAAAQPTQQESPPAAPEQGS